jgi:hypothetical protein
VTKFLHEIWSSIFKPPSKEQHRVPPRLAWPKNKVEINDYNLHLYQQAIKATMTNHSAPRKIAMWTSFIEGFEA